MQISYKYPFTLNHYISSKVENFISFLIDILKNGVFTADRSKRIDKIRSNYRIFQLEQKTNKIRFFSQKASGIHSR